MSELKTGWLSPKNRRPDDCPLVCIPDYAKLGDLNEAVRIVERLRDRNVENPDMAFALNWAAEAIKNLPALETAKSEAVSKRGAEYFCGGHMHLGHEHEDTKNEGENDE